MAKTIPVVLVVLRALCGPALIACAALSVPAPVLSALMTLAFLSDVFDGIIARRLGVATALLRLADSLVDTAFYICAAVALAVRAPAVLEAHVIGLAALGSLEVSRWVIERLRYGRIASYHMWSAKLWGIALFAAFFSLLALGSDNWLVDGAIYLGIVVDLEGLAISTILPRWRSDVPSVVHALRLRGIERA